MEKLVESQCELSKRMIDFLDNVNQPTNFPKGNPHDHMESFVAGSRDKSQIKIDVRAQMPRFDNKDASYTIVRFFRDFERITNIPKPPLSAGEKSELLRPPVAHRGAVVPSVGGA